MRESIIALLPVLILVDLVVLLATGDSDPASPYKGQEYIDYCFQLSYNLLFHNSNKFHHPLQGGAGCEFFLIEVSSAVKRCSPCLQ